MNNSFQSSGLCCILCGYEASEQHARRMRGYCDDCGRRLTGIDGATNPYPVLQVKRVKRIVTRLRFEPGSLIPDVGATWLTTTELGGELVRVKLLEKRGMMKHTDGATLIDAKVRQAILG